MSIYLSHISALDYLRSPQAVALSRSAAAQQKGGFTTLPTIPDTMSIQPTIYDELLQLENREFDYLSSPVHLLTPSAEMRIRRKGVVCHVGLQSLPKGSFIQVAPNVLACAAEPCTTQMATILSLPKLLELGCELSGYYRLSKTNPRGFIDAEPVLSLRSLEQFLRRINIVHGAKTTRRALLYIVEGSASPMETVVVLLLCLPRRLGGYGLPLPQMNGKVTVGKRARKAATKSYYKCDLYWTEANLAVEYESDLCHTGSDNLANDSARRSALAYMGIEVITLTRRQVLNTYELDRVAALLSKRLLQRQPLASSTWVTKRNELRRQLLNFSR